MKKTAIILIIVTVITIMAFKNIEVKSEGAIGDVKYSILPPDKFNEENGIGWVLMDDKIPLQGSSLNTKHGITEIPDVRGLFIRAMNLNRNDNYADPFYKETKRQRLVGELQDDSFKKHNHTTKNNVFGHKNHGFPSQEDMDPGGWGGYMKVETDEKGGLETRPKNISLYTYIKIN